MDKETNMHNLTANDIEVIEKLSSYLKEMEPVYENLDWCTKETSDNSRYLRALYHSAPKDRRYMLSLNKTVAHIRKVVKKYEAGTLASGEAEEAQAQLTNHTLDVLDDMGIPGNSREEFRSV